MVVLFIIELTQDIYQIKSVENIGGKRVARAVDYNCSLQDFTTREEAEELFRIAFQEKTKLDAKYLQFFQSTC